MDGGKFISTEKQLRLNGDIHAAQVRLIDHEGNQVGIVTLEEALDKAAEVNLDLVEISPKAQPPVCQIVDYGKLVFKRSKKLAEEKKKQKRVQTKRLRIRPSIEEGDYQVKLRNLTRFLEEGDKVEITLQFRGRQITHKELGMDILKRIQKDLSEHADVEREPRFAGKQMMMVLVPKKQ